MPAIGMPTTIMRRLLRSGYSGSTAGVSTRHSICGWRAASRASDSCVSRSSMRFSASSMFACQRVRLALNRRQRWRRARRLRDELVVALQLLLVRFAFGLGRAEAGRRRLIFGRDAGGHARDHGLLRAVRLELGDLRFERRDARMLAPCSAPWPWRARSAARRSSPRPGCSSSPTAPIVLRRLLGLIAQLGDARLERVRLGVRRLLLLLQA